MKNETIVGRAGDVTGMAGVWLVYYADKSAAVVFSNELEALRYAVENKMRVDYKKFGEQLFK